MNFQTDAMPAVKPAPDAQAEERSAHCFWCGRLVTGESTYHVPHGWFCAGGCFADFKAHYE